MDNQVFYILSAVLLGLVIGALIMYFASNNKNDASEVQKVEQKLNTYQKDVEQHFEKTADLVDDLTQSYKKVFDHLSQSAKLLLTEEQVQEQIEKRKDKRITLGFLADETTAIIEEAETAEELQQAEVGQQHINEPENSETDKLAQVSSHGEDVTETETQEPQPQAETDDNSLANTQDSKDLEELEESEETQSKD